MIYLEIAREKIRNGWSQRQGKSNVNSRRRLRAFGDR